MTIIDIIQTCQFPLALCTPHGEMRKRSKSSFRDTLNHVKEFKCMFTDQMPKQHGKSEFIIDFMKYLHQPVSSSVASCWDHALSLYKKLVWTLGFKRNFNVVTIVIDKWQYSPPPREIIYTERNYDDPQLNHLKQFDNAQIIYLPDAKFDHSIHQDALRSPFKKQALIRLICNVFISKSREELVGTSHILIHQV